MQYTYKYPKADNTVDAVIFGLTESLQVLLIERGREKEPFYKHWALPGGFINMEEDLEQALRRELKEETGLTPRYLEQLYTFGAPGRDPRGRVISTAYLGLVRPDAVRAGDDASKAEWVSVHHLPPLAFDHAEIIKLGLQRLCSKLRWQPVGLELLPEEFTLTELQHVYEEILGHSLDRRNFRSRVLRFGVLVPTGVSKVGRHRPAQLFKFDVERYQILQKQGFTFET